jgi:hypothetical protein
LRDSSRRLWLSVIGAALALALVGAAYVQWRQYRLLDGTTQFQNDALGWSFFQLEAEHLRLRNDMHEAVAEGSPARASGCSCATTSS